MGASIFFRLYPLTVYPDYAAKNKAEILVYSGVRKSLEKFISAQAPGMPAENKNKLKNEVFKKYLSDQKVKLSEMVNQTAQKISLEERKRKDPPYLMEVDPYYYLSLTQRLLMKGLPARPTKGREYFNETMLAPKGAWYPTDYHPYTGLAAYRFLSMLSKDISLEVALGYVPLFLSMLCLLPFFLISSRVFSLTWGASLVGACFLLLVPAYLRRSLWGWFDTDSYNVFFPLLILFFLFLFLKESSSLRKKNSFLLLAGLTASIYSLFWRGWLLEHALISASLLLSIVLGKTARYPGEKIADLKRVFIFYILTPLLATFFLWGSIGFSSLILEAAELTKSFYLPAFSLWPDTFLTVGELRKASFSSLIQSLGGPVAIILLFMGILPGLAHKDRSNGSTRVLTLFVAILAVITTLIGGRIERFELLAVAPIAVGVLLGAARIKLLTKNFKLFSPLSVRNFCYAVLLGLIFWQAHLTARFEHPIYNSSWDRTMTYLRENTPAESIITSWWCPGHYVTSKAKRRVTFDGATQNTPQVYWVANFFLESNEGKAAAILRMLDISANDAVDFLLSKKIKLSEAISLIHRILPLDKRQALDESQKIVGSNDSIPLVELTHGAHPPPPAYVFIYNDMVEQAMALEYTGKRNFEKAENFMNRLQNDPSGVPKNLLDRSHRDHIILTWSLSQGPYAQDTESYEERRSQEEVYFTNGLMLNLANSDIRLSSKKFGVGKPKYIYQMIHGAFEKKSVPGASLPISVLLIKESSKNANGDIISYKTVLADERLIESLLFRLYYLKGEGLHRFKLAFEEENPANRAKQYVFQVQWESN